MLYIDLPEIEPSVSKCEVSLTSCKQYTDSQQRELIKTYPLFQLNAPHLSFSIYLRSMCHSFHKLFSSLIIIRNVSLALN